MSYANIVYVQKRESGYYRVWQEFKNEGDGLICGKHSSFATRAEALIFAHNLQREECVEYGVHELDDVELIVLPCPFCGEKGSPCIYEAYFCVECKSCGARGPRRAIVDVKKLDEFRECAVKAWNMRIK